jgi:hypothetical protein
MPTPTRALPIFYFAVTLLFVIFLLVPVSAQVEQTYPARLSATVQSSELKKPLTEEEQRLVAESRKAIVETGMSETFFDSSFVLNQVLTSPGDRRVVWTITVDGVSANVNDSVGFYTDNGRRVDTHSVANTLGKTAEINRILSKQDGERIMRRCIGSASTTTGVEFRPLVRGDAATFVLTGERIIKRSAISAKERREEHERKDMDAREGQSHQRSTDRDELEEETEGENLPVIITGNVDLQTGRCIRGRAKTPSSPI